MPPGAIKALDFIAGVVVILGLPVAMALDLFDALTGRWRKA